MTVIDQPLFQRLAQTHHALLKMHGFRTWFLGQTIVQHALKAQDLLFYNNDEDFQRSLYTKLIGFHDKYESKQIAMELGCSVPETLSLKLHSADIPFHNFGSAFCVKPTQSLGSRGAFLMNDSVDLFSGNTLSLEDLQQALSSEMKRTSNFQNEYSIVPTLSLWNLLFRKALDPKNDFPDIHKPNRIMVEELILEEEHSKCNPADFKIYTICGRPIFIQYNVKPTRGLQNDTYQFYTTQWERIAPDVILPSGNFKDAGESLPRPHYLIAMLDQAQACAEEFCKQMGPFGWPPFVRVDFFHSQERGPIFVEFELPPLGSGRSFLPETSHGLWAQCQKLSWENKHNVLY